MLSIEISFGQRYSLRLPLQVSRGIFPLLSAAFIDTFDYKSKMNCFWMNKRRRNALLMCPVCLHCWLWRLYALPKVKRLTGHLTLERLMENRWCMDCAVEGTNHFQYLDLLSKFVIRWSIPRTSRLTSDALQCGQLCAIPLTVYVLEQSWSPPGVYTHCGINSVWRHRGFVRGFQLRKV